MFIFPLVISYVLTEVFIFFLNCDGISDAYIYKKKQLHRSAFVMSVKTVYTLTACN